MNTLQVLLNITFIPHQAHLMTDAIARTFYRKLVSKSLLLEWVTAAQDGRATSGDRSAVLRFMWPVIPIAAFIATLIVLLESETILVAAPFLVAWVFSPLIAYRLSQPLSHEPKRLGAEDIEVARLIARRTWRFFETFVGEEDHWLPPDNYQEDPRPVVAHRTSPTNVGMFLLSTVAAHDFGYTGSLELIERLELTFTTLEKLPRFRGHFFNWYDTQTLEPLMPQYVSTVDSGNLAGHLIVIKQACNELLERPLFAARVSAGLSDTLRVVSQEVDLLGAGRQRTAVVTVKQLRQEIDACFHLITNKAPQTLTDWSSSIAKLTERAATIQDIVNALAHEHGPESFVELRFWIGAFVHQLEVLSRDLHTVTPWAGVLARIVSVTTGRHPDNCSQQLEGIRDELNFVPVPSKIPEFCDRLLLQLAALRPELEKSLSSQSDQGEFLDNVDLLTKALERAIEVNKTLLARTGSLARLCDRLVKEMDFGFLYDEKLKVLTIGYAVSEGHRDESFYDLLASEARLAWTKSQVELRHFEVDMEEAQIFQRLAGAVFYLDQSVRPRPHVLALTNRTQAGLWPYGISGDLPIILVRISDERDLRVVKQLLRGHQYLRSKGLLVELVILNDHSASYAQSLQDELLELVRKSGAQHLADKPGGVFLRRSDIMPEADRILLHTVARVCIVTARGSLEEHLSQPSIERELPAPFIPSRPLYSDLAPAVPLENLRFFNGLGGFNQNGREYVTILSEEQWTPAPWLNIIANAANFGFQVSESGASCTWSVNSHENRLTPWSNDAVSDPSGEVIYLRDEDTGATWTPTPLPIRQTNPYVVRHGQGYTIFEHTSHGIAQELLMFVPTDAPVKIARLRLHNTTDQKRRLSVTSYTELVLGTQRSSSAPFIVTEVDQATGAMLARNPYNNDFAPRIAFVEMSASQRTFTCDRKEFLGRNGSTARPAALRRTQLSGAVGAGLDPCIALQTVLELGPGQQREIVILLGQAETVAEARLLVTRYRQIAAVKEAFEQVVGHWNEVLGAIEVHTPDAAMDIMMNRWLLYQSLSCRVWARSAFYQSSGGYGFRDQLQDVMALVYAKPEIAREHILRAAGRQFSEGDVQHWWHPPSGHGLRTRFSDVPLWLPYVTNFYIKATGDLSVLDQDVHFLEAPTIAMDETESFSQPSISAESATLFEHCARALDRSLSVGTHGLPLMGTGDWNDGMNRVGWRGKGESVWLGWFLYKTLKDFLEFCDARGETDRARSYREHLSKLKVALEQQGWDGDWYLRAFFDDGTPLGSARNDECRIDSIAQSWGIISGAADLQRGRRAMAAVEQHLILREEGLVLLLAPPFDKSVVEPGYIKGYVPGVRENGGQYTHAALWTLIAYAMLSDGDRAGELFALLNPINHADTRAGLHRYKVEPYIVAADIYAATQHTGRGGWTWYTGAAAWMYRAGLESMLGFKLHGDRLTVEPCIPRRWPGYEVIYRRAKTIYHIKVENPHGVNEGVESVELDGRVLLLNEVPLQADGTLHEVRIVLGNKSLPVEGTVSVILEQPKQLSKV